MHFAIYNRWLGTLGGGERHSLALAEYLGRRDDVTVISHNPIPKQLMAERFGLDLDAVHFLYLPDRPALQMTPITTDFDLFIHASHMDLFPSQAKRSICLIYFPLTPRINASRHFRTRGVLALRQRLMLPLFEGCYQLEVSDDGYIRHCGSSVTIHLPRSWRKYSVGFKVASNVPEIRGFRLWIDHELVQTSSFEHVGEYVLCDIDVMPGKSGAHQLVLQADTEAPADHESPVKLTIRDFKITHPRYCLYQGLFEHVFKAQGLQLNSITAPFPNLQECVDTYSNIWSISEFTQKWITAYWQRSSDVLYPVINVERFRPQTKRKRILSVGRFFAGQHNKKHAVMIKAFKQMVDSGLRGWELHLAGGTASSDALDRHLQSGYLQDLRRQAQNYPIFFHCDASYAELAQLYGESAIYWHASGFGENENLVPDQFEHFGITTVEAMASGCVPVVIGKGGQPEIVRNGQNGFLWNSLAELQSATLNLIENDELRSRCADAAVAASQGYDQSHFEQRIDQLLALALQL